MKRVLLLGCMALCLILSACGNGGGTEGVVTPAPEGVTGQPVSDTASPTDIAVSEAAGVVEQFFAAFETSDYETMKGLCTETCVATYFHDGDVFGMVSAKAVEIGKGSFKEDDRCGIFVTVEMEPSESSALYPETSTSFYVELERFGVDPWRVSRFYTG